MGPTSGISDTNPVLWEPGEADIADVLAGQELRGTERNNGLIARKISDRPRSSDLQREEWNVVWKFSRRSLHCSEEKPRSAHGRCAPRTWLNDQNTIGSHLRSQGLSATYKAVGIVCVAPSPPLPCFPGSRGMETLSMGNSGPPAAFFRDTHPEKGLRGPWPR